MLVQFDLNPSQTLDADIAAFWEQQTQLEVENRESGLVRKPAFTTDDTETVASLGVAKEFAEARVRGTLAAQKELDETIGGYLRNWSIYRLGTVERNVLRIGLWELRNCPDIPAPILVNEAIDLAKFFSETKSGKFVNGVMDRMAKDLRAPKAETFTP